ncbi:Kelch repeat-containing protein [Sanyastnella coralliicola]|uniref:Kelch repeat-containing protein n=1 Tax=Sanyastnella coralliicola TaxID=3069118 RepID=UPI0027BA7361|nr:kelch repeat-containing protein [Longitalea sp. SCSIO 12813]
MKSTLLFILTFCTLGLAAQPGWTWEPLPDMPEAVANNAVVSAMSNDTMCVYSFAGIDETLEPQGIHLKTFKYNTLSQQWSQLADVPDSQGKIAAGASYVNGLIYVVGGYYVQDNFSETSSDDIHIFDPQTDSWLDDGAVIPVPIDDQVQVTWRDSLIYVVTGWSDNGNVNDVQIYDTYLDQWSAGTSTPNNSIYKAFGASGEIVGDTIYYHGGVSGSFSFVANSRMRKGVINEDDPTQIDWSQLDNSPGEPGYRSAAAVWNDRLFWIGGGGVAYNFDALAYNGSGVVAPVPRILTYYAGIDFWEDGFTTPEEVMDFRGIGKVDETSWILCGGIGPDQNVLTSTWLLTYDPSVGVGSAAFSELEWVLVNDQLAVNTSQTVDIQVYAATGELLYQGKTRKGEPVDLSLFNGLLIVHLQTEGYLPEIIKVKR